MITIVKKYGGATLSTPEKIRSIATDLGACHQRGERLVVIVSAMGQTTNELIALAQKVSSKPKRREMDMLLTTGERVSMSLLSMALNAQNFPAISYTGSQAGVLTDDSHLNALITNVTCHRVSEALEKGQIVVIAGFQGVSPKTKEITTLGRGGSDTTAVAMAAALNADHCEILKDVSGIYTADPKICPQSVPIKRLSYQQILEMTFWGAKVLHYRSVELAYQRKIRIYIGPAHNKSEGTWINSEEQTMFESVRLLSINSHSDIVQLQIKGQSLSEGLSALQKSLEANEISFPQLLTTEEGGENSNIIYLTGPQETLEALRRENHQFNISSERLSTVTVTCTGVATPEIAVKITQQLEKNGIQTKRLWISGMSCSVLLPSDSKSSAIATLHDLIDISTLNK